MTSPELELLDYKRRVHRLYARVREDPDPEHAFATWVAERDDLFARHPQSALPPERRERFTGLAYFPHDPRGRIVADVAPAERRRYEVPSSNGEAMALERIGVARFALGETACELELYWLLGYGGGLFVPFADATSGEETYGAGRYLLDTIKGADLGMARRPPGARLQPRLQPVVLLRPPLDLPAGSTTEPPPDPRAHGGARVTAATERAHHRRRFSGRDPDEPHRASTPLELLYDLTIVVAFGTAADELAHYVAEGHVAAGVGGFAFAAFAVSWAWLNYSWFASAYDTDDWVFRLATMVQMVGVIVLVARPAADVRVDRPRRHARQRRDGRGLRGHARRARVPVVAGLAPRPRRAGAAAR